MDQKKLRTQDEKAALVSAFLKSGLSRSQWCKEHKIPITTFSAWIQKQKTKVSFIPVTSTKTTPSIKDRASIIQDIKDEIVIEIKDCKIKITENSSMLLLKKVLKVVQDLDV